MAIGDLMESAGARMSFEGKTAVVTGAGGGMGLNIALDLVASGATVGMIDLKEAPRQLDRDPARMRYHQGDLTDEEFVNDSIASVFEAGNRLDYLVNAAGVLWFGRDRSAMDVDLDVWDRVLEINLKSLVHTARSAVPLMKKTGAGAMVHVATTQCLRGDDKPQDAYQAAKAGVIALSKSLAIQLAGDGIRSNVLIPGSTDSPMQARWSADPGSKAATAASIPLGRVGSTQDMSNAVLFLLSERASYITGTELVVDGGYLAKP